MVNWEKKIIGFSITAAISETYVLNNTGVCVMSVDPHRDRTLAYVSLLINLMKSMVKHFNLLASEFYI